jgi:hypothetical protein
MMPKIATAECVSAPGEGGIVAEFKKPWETQSLRLLVRRATIACPLGRSLTI